MHLHKAAKTWLRRAIGAVLITVVFAQTPKQPLNVELTGRAWDAFNKGNFEGAIDAAGRCIKEFGADADREQDKLVKSHAKMPGTSAAEKEKIMARGLLNDVAACTYIKARSEESLKRLNEARTSYTACKKYTYARIWDPNGWFWDPSQKCEDLLKQLK